MQDQVLALRLLALDSILGIPDRSLDPITFAVTSRLQLRDDLLLTSDHLPCGKIVLAVFEHDEPVFVCSIRDAYAGPAVTIGLAEAGTWRSNLDEIFEAVEALATGSARPDPGSWKVASIIEAAGS